MCTCTRIDCVGTYITIHCKHQALCGKTKVSCFVLHSKNAGAALHVWAAQDQLNHNLNALPLYLVFFIHAALLHLIVPFNTVPHIPGVRTSMPQVLLELARIAVPLITASHTSGLRPCLVRHARCWGSCHGEHAQDKPCKFGAKQGPALRGGRLEWHVCTSSRFSDECVRSSLLLLDPYDCCHHLICKLFSRTNSC